MTKKVDGKRDTVFIIQDTNVRHGLNLLDIISSTDQGQIGMELVGYGNVIKYVQNQNRPQKVRKAKFLRYSHKLGIAYGYRAARGVLSSVSRQQPGYHTSPCAEYVPRLMRKMLETIARTNIAFTQIY